MRRSNVQSMLFITVVSLGLWCSISTGDDSQSEKSWPLETHTKKIGRPAGVTPSGLLPRPVLLVEAVQRDELWDQKSRTNYYIYDTEKPEQGFQQTFSGPDEEQYCHFETPLFGGWGVASGHINARQRPTGNCLFWFNPMTGTIGPKIAESPYAFWRSGTELRFLTRGGLNRFDVKSGTLTHFRWEFEPTCFIDKGESMLGSVNVKGVNHVAKVDMTKGIITLICPFPPGLPLKTDGFWRGNGVHPAGPSAKDGLYLISENSLWYKPCGDNWKQVVEGVNVEKIFGGWGPHLPVAYIGEGRFAVARTVEGSEYEDKVSKMPRALSVTMLIEAKTGKILKETEPVTYDTNPELNIPETWWSEEARQKRQSLDADERKKAMTVLFSDAENGKVVVFGKGKQYRTAEKDKKRVSSDGRYMVVYRDWSENKNPPATLSFHILDGKEEKIRVCRITTPTKTLFVLHLGWEMLCDSDPPANDIEQYLPSDPDPFYTPIW